MSKYALPWPVRAFWDNRKAISKWYRGDSWYEKAVKTAKKRAPAKASS